MITNGSYSLSLVAVLDKNLSSRSHHPSVCNVEYFLNENHTICGIYLDRPQLYGGLYPLDALPRPIILSPAV